MEFFWWIIFAQKWDCLVLFLKILGSCVSMGGKEFLFHAVAAEKWKLLLWIICCDIYLSIRQKSLLLSKGVAYFKGLFSVQKSQVVALLGPWGVVSIYCKALQKPDQKTFHNIFFFLSFLKSGAKGAASLLLLPCQPNCHVVYFWLVPVWGRSGFNSVVRPHSKQDWVVVCSSTSDCANF